MSDKIQTVDVEKIMEEIRRNIKERGYTEEMLSFSEAASDAEIQNGIPVDDAVYNEAELNQYLQSARAGHNIPYYEPVSYTHLRAHET